MSWIANRVSWRRLTLAAILSTSATAAAADVLVVRSSGPSASAYPAGRSLADTTRIALRSGDTLVVLDARGTRTYRGPGNFTAAAAPQQGVRTAEANGRRARIGAVRSAGYVASSPTTIWHVDVSQSGNMCLASTSNVMLWRPEASQTATLSISGPGGAMRNVQWPAGRTSVAWPSDLQIANGAAYQLRQSGSPVPSTITFRTLDSAPGADMPSIAGALIRHGCQEQLDLLIDSAPSG